MIVYFHTGGANKVLMYSGGLVNVECVDLFRIENADSQFIEPDIIRINGSMPLHIIEFYRHYKLIHSLTLDTGRIQQTF